MQNVAGRPEASTTICACRRDLRVARTQPVDLAGHIAFAGRRGQDVEAFGAGGDAAALLARLADLQGERMRGQGGASPVVVIQRPGLMAFGSTVPCGRSVESHVVDPSIALQRRRREARRTSRRRGAGPRCWRTSGASPASARWSGADPRGGGPAPALPRAQVPDRRAHPARQPPQGAVLRAGITGYEPRRHDRRERLEELLPATGGPCRRT